jgi:hypothetical protein
MFKRVSSCALILLLVFSFAGCGKKSNKELTKEVAKDKIITLGENKGNVYTNDFFKMTINMPDKWVVATDEEKTEVLNLGKEIVAGDDKDKAKQLDLSTLRSVYLLMISEKGLQVKSAGNPNFMVLAEKLSFLQGINNGSDYLASIKKQLKSLSSTVPYNLDKEIYTEKIGGKNFSVLEATLEAGTIKMTQKYYACVLNGYALSFISTGTDDANAKILDTILKSITFK